MTREASFSRPTDPLRAASQGWNQNTATTNSGELSQSTVQEIRSWLRQMGFYRGTVDGNWRPETQSAPADFQQQRGLRGDGRLTFRTLAEPGMMQSRQYGSNEYGNRYRNGTCNGSGCGNNGMRGNNGYILNGTGQYNSTDNRYNTRRPRE